MDEFPEDLSKPSCAKIIAEKQKDLIKQVRQEFYEEIIEATNACESHVVLTFPNKLWHKYRKMITEELLERFGEFEISSPKSTHQWNVTKMTDSAEDIPDFIKQLKIVLNVV